MRVHRFLCFFVLLTSPYWLAPLSGYCAVREEIADKYKKRYQEWKADFLSTDIGRKQWAGYAQNTRFTLTITVSNHNRNGGVTSKYKWGESGELIASTITLGDRINEGYPNPIYYPVLNSLAAPASESAISGSILAAAKFAHEFGHVNRMAITDGAFYQLQHRLIPTYNAILLNNGRNTRDPQLIELKQRMGGTPVQIWADREYWGEANAMLYLQDRISNERVKCALFRRIRQSVELYAAGYAARFVPAAQATSASHPCCCQ